MDWEAATGHLAALVESHGPLSRFFSEWHGRKARSTRRIPLTRCQKVEDGRPVSLINGVEERRRLLEDWLREAHKGAGSAREAGGIGICPRGSMRGAIMGVRKGLRLGVGRERIVVFKVELFFVLLFVIVARVQSAEKAISILPVGWFL